MNIVKYILASTFFIIFHQTGYTQDPIVSTNSSYRHYIGAAVGYTTGNGISYRYCQNKLGGQLTFFASEYNDDRRISVGLTFLYKLVQKERAELFFYTSHRFKNETYNPYRYNYSRSSYKNLLKGKWNCVSPMNTRT
ncbi:MAG: hypothetical protein JEZ03_14015 [Bacteroidales bacterium]|nr:hypothetical protein [Bacteroidales bacterium]